MALDPLLPVKLGARLGIGILRFELRVLARLLGVEDERPRPEPEPGPAAVRVPIRNRTEPLAPEPPAHIDTHAELVAEFSEPGAEEGAGAEVHVDEPWDGYRRMQAADIRDRIVLAGPAELAVIQLYETAHRRRRTVLDAVEQRSRQLANAPR